MNLTNIQKLTLNDFIFAAARNSDKAFSVLQGDAGKIGDVKINLRTMTNDDRLVSMNMRSQFANVLSAAYREAGLSQEKIDALCDRLGVGAGDAAGIKHFETPLTGREIKSVLETAQKELDGGEGVNLIYQEKYELQQCGLYDRQKYESAFRQIASGACAKPESMASALKAVMKKVPAGSFPGLTDKNVGTFVKTNFAQLKQLTFDHIYRKTYAQGGEVGLGASLAFAVSRLMRMYGSQGAGLHPDLMPVTTSLKLVMGEAMPHVDRVLAARFPPPSGLRGLLDTLRGYSNADSPTARRLGMVADRLETAWIEAARSQNGEDRMQNRDNALEQLRRTLGDSLGKLLDCDWREATVNGDEFLKKLDARLIINLAKNGTDVQPTLVDIVSALKGAAAGLMVQGEMVAMAKEFASLETIKVIKEGVGIDKIGKEGINKILEQAAKIARPGSDTLKTLYEAAFNAGGVQKADFEQASGDVKAAYDAFKARIEELVDGVVQEVRGRELVIAEAAANLSPINEPWAGNAAIHRGDKVIKCKILLVSQYYSGDKLKEFGLDMLNSRGEIQFASEEERQEILRKVDEQLGRIPDAWFKPVVNWLKNGMKFSKDMLPIVLDGLGNQAVHPLFSSTLEGFASQMKQYDSLTNILSTMMGSGNYIDLSKTGQVLAEYLRGRGVNVEPYENYNPPAAKENAGQFERTLANPEFKGLAYVANMASLCKGGKTRDELTFPVTEFGRVGLRDMLGLMKSFRIEASELGTDVGIAKMMLVRMLLEARLGNMDGLAEWGQRQFGIDFTTIAPEQFTKAAMAIGKYIEKRAEDPLQKLAQSDPAVNFLAGRCKFEEAKLTAADMRALIGALGAVKRGDASATCKVGKESLTVASGPDGKSVVFALRDHKGMQIRYSQSVADMLTFLNMQVASDAKSDVQLLKDLVSKLGDLHQNEMPTARAREMMVRILTARLGKPSVTFASMSQKELHTLTMQVLNADRPLAERDIPKPHGYYADETKVQLAAYDEAEEVDKASVTMMPKVNVARTPEQRLADAMKPESVRMLFGDLFMNADVTLFDAEQRPDAAKGRRVRSLIDANRIELRVLVNANEADLTTGLAALPEPMRDEAKALLTSLRTLVNDYDTLDDEAKLAQCAQFEARLDEAANRVMTKLQGKAAELFVDRPDNSDQLTDWKKPLEATGRLGIDVGTSEGQIVSTVLKHYLTDCDAIEKRAMMAAYLRHAVPGDDGALSDGQQLAAALKGAGPVLQKMMQGLPIDSFGPETQKAIKDMKSNLLPIPDTVIRAKLLDLVRNSNGEIKSVTVIKPIGSATVAQALLCHIKTKDSPYTGKDVVIKLQRPNSQLAAMREQATIAGILAQHVPDNKREALIATFNQQYADILKEFDFTIEAENIDVAYTNYNVVDNKHSSVHSMDRYRNIMPNAGVLVLEKVNGDTLESSTDKLRAKTNLTGVQEAQYALEPNGPTELRYEADSFKALLAARHQLKETHDALLAQRKALVNLIDLWFDKGLMGDGFFHADMHAGNMMTSVNPLNKSSVEVSFIDFGNVQRMTKTEQANLLNFVVSCGVYDPNDGADKFIAVLKKMVPDYDAKITGEKANQLKAKLVGIFSKAGDEQLLAKLGVAVATVQSYGLTLPPSVGAFLTSVSRLRNGLQSVDAALAQCENKMSRLGRKLPPDPSCADLANLFTGGAKPIGDALVAMQALMEATSVYGEHNSTIDGLRKAFSKVVGAIKDIPKGDLEAMFQSGPNGEASPIRQLHQFISTIAMDDNVTLRNELTELSQTIEQFERGESTINDKYGYHIYLMLDLIAGHCLVSDHKEEELTSFEGVLTKVLSNYQTRLLKDVGMVMGGNYVISSDLETKNEELQEAALRTIREKYGENAQKAQTICAYVGTFRLPGGIFASTLDGANLNDVLTFFCAGLQKALGHEGEALSAEEVRMAVDALKARKVAKAPALMSAPGMGVFFGKRKFSANTSDLYAAVDHPILQAVKGLKAGQADELRGSVGEDVQGLVAGLRS